VFANVLTIGRITLIKLCRQSGLITGDFFTLLQQFSDALCVPLVSLYMLILHQKGFEVYREFKHTVLKRDN
jgi:hypothetical protein